MDCESCRLARRQPAVAHLDLLAAIPTELVVFRPRVRAHVVDLARLDVVSTLPTVVEPDRFVVLAVVACFVWHWILSGELNERLPVGKEKESEKDEAPVFRHEKPASALQAAVRVGQLT